MQDTQESDTLWRDETPVSRRFYDPYFSLEDGLAETRHVFLAGNDLPARFRPGFRIAELGFGTGLNLIAAWRAWQEAGLPGQLGYTGFEAFPMATADLARALKHFPELADLTALLLDAWSRGERRLTAPGIDAEIIVGDARATLPLWPGMADAWFLDGFAPARNPELWEPSLIGAVAAHTNPGGTAATYTAAGAVRRTLQEAGFAVTRCPGFGRKRHMTRAVLA